LISVVAQIDKMKERAAQERGGRKPTYLTSATSVLTSITAVSVVPSGGDKMGLRTENTDVRWVGFHPLSGKKKLLSQKRNTTIHLHAFWEKKQPFTFIHSGVTVSDSARVRRSPDERQWEMNSTAAFAPSMNSDFCGQCCKTFFIRNLSVVVIR